MNVEDLTIEVRQRDYSRVGQILHDELDIQASVLFNNVGEWSLTLRDEHHLVPALRTPGAGLIVTGPDGKVLLSGPAVQPSFEATPQDRQGQVTIAGVTDDIILQDRLAFPDPAISDPAGQRYGEDVRTGVAETLMHQYVNLNAGPGAPVARQTPGLRMGVDSARGMSVTMRARFITLGELLNQIAAANTAAGSVPIGFRVVQSGDGLVFETYQTQERVDTVQLSVQNDGLSGQRTIVSAPRITRAIVGGKGELEDRNLIEVSNSTSTAAETEWGRRIEVFVDHRQEEGTNELTQAGGEALSEGGGTSLSVELIPAENASQAFGREWNLGDRISAQVDSTTVAQAYVNGYAFAISAQEGFIFGATLSETLAVYKASSLDSRVSALERNEGQGITGEIKMWALATAPAGYLICDGSEKPIASYPALAALIGTTFGSASAGNFRLPNFRGRSPVGAGAADSGSAGNNYALGQKWGHEAMPAHSHGVSDPGHGHIYDEMAFDYWAAPGSSNPAIAAHTGAREWRNVQGAYTNVSIQSAGSGNTGNVHPVLAVNYIIKT